MRIRSFFTALLIVGLVYGCSSDKGDTNFTEEANNFVTQLKSLAQDNAGHNAYVVFDLAIDEENNITVSETGIVEKTQHSSAFLGFKKKQSGIVIQMPTASRSAITVCCTTDGEEYQCQTCPEGAGQNLCIIQAVNACTDQSGCAVVCEQKMYFDPGKNEFFIVNK